jgi:DNA-binding CsgD family transcriptional regulator
MDFEGARRHTYRALELAEEIGERGLLAEALAYCVMWDYLCGRGVDWKKLERALTLEDPGRVVPLQSRPSVVAGCLQLYVGRHAEARERLVALRGKLEEQGDESDLAYLLMWLSWLETRAGNLDTAADLAEAAAANAALTGTRLMYAWARLQGGYVHAHRGEVEEARAACAEGAAYVERSGTGLLGVWIAASLALVELPLGNPRGAWEACEALIALGQLDRVEPLLADLERRGRELDRAWALACAGRTRGLLLAARGDVQGALESFERALTEHERIELPFERARLLLARGLVERRARRRTRSKATLEEALAEFERMGARPFAERARSELGRIGLRRSNGDELTASERAVAELAAAGHTNREIAAQLFISPKTVEARLGRTYRKLGIRSRAQLGSHLQT